MTMKALLLKILVSTMVTTSRFMKSSNRLKGSTLRLLLHLHSQMNNSSTNFQVSLLKRSLPRLTLLTTSKRNTLHRRSRWQLRKLLRESKIALPRNKMVSRTHLSRRRSLRWGPSSRWTTQTTKWRSGFNLNINQFNPLLSPWMPSMDISIVKHANWEIPCSCSLLQRDLNLVWGTTHLLALHVKWTLLNWCLKKKRDRSRLILNSKPRPSRLKMTSIKKAEGILLRWSLPKTQPKELKKFARLDQGRVLWKFTKLL